MPVYCVNTVVVVMRLYQTCVLAQLLSKTPSPKTMYLNSSFNSKERVSTDEAGKEVVILRDAWAHFVDGDL